MFVWCTFLADGRTVQCLCCDCLQLLEAMNQDSGIPLTVLQVDGGMTVNNLLMQIQADILQINVGRFCSFFCPLCSQCQLGEEGCKGEIF